MTERGIKDVKHNHTTEGTRIFSLFMCVLFKVSCSWHHVVLLRF